MVFRFWQVVSPRWSIVSLSGCAPRFVAPHDTWLNQICQSKLWPALVCFDVRLRGGGATLSLVAATSSRGRPLRTRSSRSGDGRSSSLASTADTQRSIVIAGKDSSSKVCIVNISESSSVRGVGTGEPIPRFRRSSISRNIRADTTPLDLDVEEHAAPRCFALTPAVDVTVFVVVVVVVVDGAFCRKSSSFDCCRPDAIYRLVHNVSPCWQPCKYQPTTINVADLVGKGRDIVTNVTNAQSVFKNILRRRFSRPRGKLFTLAYHMLKRLLAFH